ncbi:MAG: TRAP transporter small permease subunit [Rhodobacteraceae bacterium]|nr:TRAP transporter small permease subunit [Paracoccaceae bacterium]
MEPTEELIKLSDPGEVGREEHTPADRLVVWVSNIFAWLFPILMIAICSQVVLRSSGMNQAWLDDFQWWLYGAAVLVGIAYAVTTNSHVRVDIFYDNFNERKKARTEVFALAWLFLPFIILAWDVTFHYAYSSVLANEGSDSPNGLHNLWILKVFMNVAFLFIAFATWAAYVRNLEKLTDAVFWKQLFWAFPSVMFIINLTVYYSIWWYLWLTGPEDMVQRDVGRAEIFDEYEIGPYDIEYTIMITIVVTLLVILLARGSARRSSAK